MKTMRQTKVLPGSFESDSRDRRQGPTAAVASPSSGGERRGGCDHYKYGVPPLGGRDCATPDDLKCFIARVSARALPAKARTPNPSTRASILIIVLWVMFALVCVAIYFGHSMSLELRAADSREAAIESDQIIQGAVRYVSFVLSNNLTGPGTVPDPQSYQAEAVQVGHGHFWLIGRTNNTDQPTLANFGLIDEASKININYADSNMLSMLPGMTAELVANVMAWRSTNANSTSGGAESESYQRLPTPYMCKNAPFETTGELRLIYDIDMTNLFNEDANQNGVLDQNENDGDTLPPGDNQNGQLESGLLEYVTVYTREPNVITNGTARLNVTNATSTAVQNLLTTNGIDSGRVQTILANLGFSSGGGAAPPSGRGSTGTGGTGGPSGTTTGTRAVAAAAASTPTFTSVLDFYLKSQMTPQEFALVEPSLRGARVQGLINVNTASSQVLGCLPGIATNIVQQIVSYRQSNPINPNSMGWLPTALGTTAAAQLSASAGQWLTGRSYQFTADIAALGHNGRGYRRTKFIFDTTQSAPIVLYRQDMTHMGWALGKQVRDKWLLAKNTK